MPDQPEKPAAAEEQTAVAAELNYIPLINLALYQNSIPVVYELALSNRSGSDLEQLECVFTSSPDFIREKTVAVDLLKSEDKLPLHDLGLELNYQLLSSISEMMNGKLNLEIRQRGQTLFRKDYDLAAFAADQWLGLRVMPELLCSFVTPNLDVINHLLTLVAEELKTATGSASIEGYQGDKRRVYEICSAIYRAIHSWGIHQGPRCRHLDVQTEAGRHHHLREERLHRRIREVRHAGQRAGFHRVAPNHLLCRHPPS